MCLNAQGLKAFPQPVKQTQPIKAWKGFNNPNQYGYVNYEHKLIKCLDGQFRSVPWVTEAPNKAGTLTELSVMGGKVEVGKWNEDKNTKKIQCGGYTEVDVPDPNDPTKTIKKSVPVEYDAGYHACKTEADAKKYHNYDHGVMIVPVLLDDIVAEGTQSDANCLVAKKIFVDPNDLPKVKDKVTEQHEEFKKKYKY